MNQLNKELMFNKTKSFFLYANDDDLIVIQSSIEVNAMGGCGSSNEKCKFDIQK